MWWLDLFLVAKNSGHPVALSMTVRACIFLVVLLPVTLAEENYTCYGPIMSTWTSSQGSGFALLGSGILPYHFTAVILYCWQTGQFLTVRSTAASSPGQ